jgi:hypothetical protein
MTALQEHQSTTEQKAGRNHSGSHNAGGLDW